MYRMTMVVKNLLIINALVMLAQMLLPFGDAMTNMLGLHYWQSPDFNPVQLITYMFLHGNPQHLFFNMFALWMFGRILEGEIGSKRFLTFYLITGVGAALFNMGVMELDFMSVKSAIAAYTQNPTVDGFSALLNSSFHNVNEAAVDPFIAAWSLDPTNPTYIRQAFEIIDILKTNAFDSLTVGASGAVYGILLAFGLMHPNDRIMLLFPPIPMKAKYFVMGYGALELILGLSNSGSSIAHFAHLGGMLWAWLLLRYWKKKGYIYY